MHKWLMMTLFVIASVFSLALVTIDLSSKNAGEEEEAAAGENLVKIVASSDFTFDKPEYIVKAGEKVKLKLKNKSGFHGAAIKDFNIDLTQDHPEAEVTFDKPGKYEIHCSVMCGTGHADMKSYLVVQ